MKRYCLCLIIALACCGMIGAVTITPYQIPTTGMVRTTGVVPAQPFAEATAAVALPSASAMARPSVGRAVHQITPNLSLPVVSVALPSKHANAAVVPQLRTENLNIGYNAAYVEVLPSKASNRRGAPPTSGSAFDKWLQSTGQGALVNTDNGIGYYDMNMLYDLWLNNPSHGDMPGTWDAFLDWFNNNSNVRVPLSDAPLFMLLLMGCYMAYAVNHKKPSKNKPS